MVTVFLMPVKKAVHASFDEGVGRLGLCEIDLIAAQQGDDAVGHPADPVRSAGFGHGYETKVVWAVGAELRSVMVRLS